MNQETLKKYLSYDEKTGLFTWIKTTTNRVNVGDTLNRTDAYGYITTSINCNQYKAHRLAWLYVYGEFPKDHIDHINGTRSDNRIKNLRNATDEINGRNKKINTRNKSGITGVNWSVDRNKWETYISNKGKTISLGRYNNLLDAVSARKSAEIKMGFHENHGRKF